MLRNTETSYGSVAKWLHWLVALWVLAAYAIIFTFHWVYGSDNSVRGLFITSHKAVGFSVLVLVAFRVYWRLTNPVPKLPADMPGWQVRLSHLSHFLLYFFLVAMPVAGYLGNTTGVRYGSFQITPFPETILANWIFSTFNITFEQWEVPFDTFHYRISGPFIVWVLVLLHASAAIYHHTVKKDDVLRRMLPGRSEP